MFTVPSAEQLGRVAYEAERSYANLTMTWEQLPEEQRRRRRFIGLQVAELVRRVNDEVTR